MAKKQDSHLESGNYRYSLSAKWIKAMILLHFMVLTYGIDVPQNIA
jgi:hypothetical protein